jgi:RNA methyltransferase, TrmH family
VVEGAELLSVALATGVAIEAVYVAPAGRSNPAVADTVDRAFAAGVRVFDLAPGVIERIADTVTPQPLLAVAGFVPAMLEDVRDASSVVVCVDIRDPGNAGTMIRTADAAGIEAVICCDGTVDPTNPKTVRASAGSLFHLPVVSGGEPELVIETLKGWGFTTVGTAVRDGVDYAGFDWRQRVALVFGNEAAGLDTALLDGLDATVSIPMAGGAESLNVSVSAAVLCFEALRQRRTDGAVPGRSARTGPLPSGDVRQPSMPGSAAQSSPGPTISPMDPTLPDPTEQRPGEGTEGSSL